MTDSVPPIDVTLNDALGAHAGRRADRRAFFKAAAGAAVAGAALSWTAAAEAQAALADHLAVPETLEFR